MTIDTIASKVIPPLVILIVVAVAGVVIRSNSQEEALSECKAVNSSQWLFITENTKKSIRNEEKINCSNKGK